jgi:Concanavalin A-like lectin/glucanases superfamily
MPTPHLHSSLRLVIIAGAVALLCLSLAIGSTYGALTGRITNTNDKNGSGTLLYTHTYAGGTTCSSVPSSGPILITSAFSCPGGIQPATATPTSGSSSGSDSIQYRGTALAARVTQTVSAASCGPVQLANAAKIANPMLARYGTSFNATGGPMDSAGFITLDGATPGAYESGVNLSSEPPTGALSLGPRYGLGIWFRADAGNNGPLLSFASSAVNGSGNVDRVLYLDAGGKLSFIFNTGGTAIGPSNGTYTDGLWHFAYVTMSAVTVLVATVPTVTLYVDGAQQATTPLLGGLAGYTSYPGYWHAGWAPRATTGLTTDYFRGSLAQLAVLDTSPAPTGTTLGKPTTQMAYSSAIATSVSEFWPLNDTGTSTFGGPYPYTVSSSTNPCSLVNVSWGFTNPTTCGWSPNSLTAACSDPPVSSLAAFVSAGAQTIASPAPGATQTSTIKLSRGAGYDTTFLPGLRLYAPLTFKATSGGWVNTFTWAAATSAFLA